MKPISTMVMNITLALVGGLMFTACSNDKTADIKEDSIQPAKVQLVKILPPTAALAAANADTATEECAHDALKHLCFVCNDTLRDSNHLWCREHSVYEERCFLCHPELKDASRLWCREHNLYEDECYLCHPEIVPASSEKPQAKASSERDPSRLWCQEHDLYEDECLICHPDLADSPGGSTSGGLMCNEHSVLEAECGICHPDLLTSRTLKIRFASEKSAEKAGIRTAPAERGLISDAVEVYAEMTFNQNQLTEIALPFEGIVKSVIVDLGAKVKEGDVLATVSSIKISEAVGRYQSAVTEEELTGKALDREKALNKQEISPAEDLENALSAYRKAEVEKRQGYQQLLTLGFDEAQIDRLVNEPAAAVVLEIRAPFNGEIVARQAVRGSWIESGVSLFTLTDTSSLWAILSIPESELRNIKVGQDVQVLVDSLPNEPFIGKLTWISSQIDDRTRTARARAEFINLEEKLKANMFVRARIIKREGNELLLPAQAIQRVDGHPVAFVQQANDLFEARMLRTGARQDDMVEVLQGIALNEMVVVENSFTVKSQLLLSLLGAGCVDD